MIMAGRGKRLVDAGEPSKQIGALTITSNESPFDLPTLISKIKEIDVTNVNLSVTSSIHNLFKKLCTTKEVMKNILSELHNEALIDSSFSDKFLVAFEEILNFEIEEVKVRSELLSFMQSDFDSKDAMCQSDQKKFLNAVSFLGCAYRRVTVRGEPVSILGVALFEYFDLLLKGEEESLRVMAMQVLINGKSLSCAKKLSDKYQLFQHNLRNTLISSNLNLKSKCWILLCLDFITNNFKLYSGIIHDFYVLNLGDDYEKLDSFLKISSVQPNYTFNSSEDVKSQNSDYSKDKNIHPIYKKLDNSKKDFFEKFSNMNLTITDDNAEKIQLKKNKDLKKWQNDEKLTKNKSSSVFGHDDRFDKEEDFYGIQMPRRPKPVNQKKSINDSKGKKKNDFNSESNSKIVFDKNKEPENQQYYEETSWD